MLEFGFIVSAFVAGVLMFLAPCTLPLLPAYLAFISGTSLEDLKDISKAKNVRRLILLNGVFFVLGFSLIFILFGSVAGFLGQGLSSFRLWITQIGGAIIILFGLFMLGVFKLPALQIDKRITLPRFLHVGMPSSSFMIGALFAFGWTPCVGPILASILLIASTSSTALQGALLLAVFSLGLSIPFLLVALLISSATKLIEKSARHLNTVSIIGGIFLIILGALLLTDNFGLTIHYGYKWLEFLNYDALLNYL